jgi:hypothetical protein
MYEALHYTVFFKLLFLSPFGSKYSLQHPILNLCSSFNVIDQVSHPYKTTDKIMVLYTLDFRFLQNLLSSRLLSKT